MLDSLNTSNNDTNENKETIEKILQEYERNFLTIESTECFPGSLPGDNYMSVVKRVKIVGKLANDTGKSNHFINSIKTIN